MKIKFEIAEQNLSGLIAFLLSSENALPDGEGRFVEIDKMGSTSERCALITISVIVREGYVAKVKRSPQPYTGYDQVEHRIPEELFLKFFRAAGIVEQT